MDFLEICIDKNFMGYLVLKRVKKKVKYKYLIPRK